MSIKNVSLLYNLLARDLLDYISLIYKIYN